MRSDIEFDANGVCLRGWLYLPDNTPEPYPLVVMAHGFSGVKEQGLDDYAAVFCGAGLAVLVYDHRNLGASDGQPRQEIDPNAQRRDYSHAITYACGLPQIDAGRIGVWGTSFTGGIVIMAAASDRRIKCVVSQVPYLHALKTLDLSATPEGIRELHALLDRERRSLAAGNPSTLIPVCTPDPAKPASSAGRRSFAYFNSFVEAGRAVWPNQFTVRSLELRLEYDALGVIDHVSPTPLLMIVADNDEITPTRLALEAYERALQPKRLVLMQGDHYEPYLSGFERSSQAARDWFVQHL